MPDTPRRLRVVTSFSPCARCWRSLAFPARRPRISRWRCRPATGSLIATTTRRPTWPRWCERLNDCCPPRPRRTLMRFDWRRGSTTRCTTRRRRPVPTKRRAPTWPRQSWRRAGVRSGLVEETARLIRLTAGHQVAPDDASGAVLVDADLAILAAPPDAYDRYTVEVRAEYGHLDDDAWRTGRRARTQPLPRRAGPVPHRRRLRTAGRAGPSEHAPRVARARRLKPRGGGRCPGVTAKAAAGDRPDADHHGGAAGPPRVAGAPAPGR